MIELFLSTDGKHTVHVSADTPEEMESLAPKAKSLYKTVLKEFGSKPQLWAAANHQGNGDIPVGRRIDTVEQAIEAVAPRCPKHNQAMVYRQGRRGPFWSCPVREANGWCTQTREVSPSQQGWKSTAA